jgi:hypothetical protein
VARNGRISRDEAFLRDVNDRIEEVSQAFSKGDEDPGAAKAEFLCECGNAQCRESLHMSVREYESIRRDRALLIVFPEHEDERVDEVVARFERYVVVRKHGEEAAVAEPTHPHGS